jgi:hypothetical protein
VYCSEVNAYHLSMSQIVAVALFCLAVCPAFAQTTVRQPTDDAPTIWAPPILWRFDDNSVAKATVPKELIASLRVSGFTILLEEDDKMETLQTHLGGVIGVQGDAADSLRWLCLHGNDAAGQWVLWLESGEIDGPYVGGFQWRRVSRSARFDERCSALPNTSEVELPIDLGLGTSEAKVIQILGRPTSRRGNTLLYEHEHDELIRGEQFTSFNTVIVALRRGAVWAIDVIKTTTN